MQRCCCDYCIDGEKSANRFWATQPAKLLFLGGLVCVTPFLSGCTFWSLSGNGPVSKNEAYRAANRVPLQMTAGEKELANKLYNNARSKGDGKTSDTAVGKAVMTGLFTLGLNLRIEKVCVDAPGGLEDSLYTCDRGFIPGYPLMWPWWSEWITTYDMKTGEEVKQSALHGLGLGSCLGGYACQISPELKGARVSWAPYRSDFSGKYTVKTAHHFLFGAFAKGQVNHRKYMQIFWIPIPLGPVDG